MGGKKREKDIFILVCEYNNKFFVFCVVVTRLLK